MKKLLFMASALLAGFTGFAQTYTPVTVTGFNADIVANGTGNSNLSTNSAVDSPADNYCFVAQDFINSSNQAPTTFLPTNRIVNSAALPGLPFQLEPYSGNNSLKIAGGSSGTLTLSSPISASQVCVLAATGYPSTTTVTVNFTDATTQVFAGQSLPNWFGGAGFAIKGISRVHRGTDLIEHSTDDPRIYQFVLNLSAANVSKTVQSVTFANTTAGSLLHAMAVTILSTPSTLTTDAGITSIMAPNSGCVLTSQETVTVVVKNHGTSPQSNIPVAYRINTGAWISEVVPGPLAANSSVNYSFTAKANLSALGSYALEAKTNLSGDLLASNDSFSKTVVLSTAPAAPSLSVSGSASLCTGGIVTLTGASATPGVTYQWFKDGVAIANATSANYTANTAGSYTVTALTGACASQASAATVLTLTSTPIAPALTAAGPLAICPGSSLTFTASSVAGATFTWFKNNTVIPGATAITYSATTAGSYTVTASLNGCASPSSPPSIVTLKTAPATPTVTQAGMVLTSSSTTGNQWYKNGVLISGAVNRTFTLNSNGTYTVVVTGNGCSSAPSAAVNITSLGIKNDQQLKLAIYPNPSTGLVNLTLPESQVYEITVADITGKVILNQKVNETKAQLNLNPASKGIYLLKISSQGATTIRKLIIE